MSKPRPVVIYGASGYTGRLVAEFLREYNIPFVAAGRSKARLQEIMNSVPGIETADYEIAEVDGTAEALTALLEGRSHSDAAAEFEEAPARKPCHIFLRQPRKRRDNA